MTDPIDPQRARRRAQAIKYVGALDGIRALAALGVVVIHSESEANASITAYAITGAFTGPLFMAFFVITGFVLYRGWAKRHNALGNETPAQRAQPASAAGGSDGRVGSYLLRRLIRIYPLYWIVATVAIALSGNPSPSIGDRIQVYLLSPWPHPEALNIGMGIVMWTLVVDIVFYLYVSLHGMVMTWVIGRSRHRSPFWVETAVLLPMFGAILLAAPFVRAPIAALACLPMGMFFAVIEAEQDRIHRRIYFVRLILGNMKVWFVLIATLGPVIIWSVVDHQRDDQAFITDTWGVHILLVLASGLLMMSVLWGRKSWPFNRLLASNWMQQAGKLTYGTYLWHPVVLRLVQRNDPHAGLAVYLPAAVIGSISLAFVTYHLVEVPLSKVRTNLRDAPPAAPPDAPGPAAS